MTRPWQVSWRAWGWIALTAAVYALLAKLSLSFYSTNNLVTIFWPGAGLALAAILLGGRKMALGVFLGSLLGMAWTGHALLPAMLLALGSTLEPLLGAWLLARKRVFDVSLQTSVEFYRLCWLAGAFSPLASTVLGIGTLSALGRVPASQQWMYFVHWWFGDTLGIVLVTPIILVWRRPPRFGARHALEALATLSVAFLAGQVVFLDWFRNSIGLINRGYWLYIIVAWSAVRLGLHGVLAVILLVFVQGLIGAVRGAGFFGDDLAATQLLNLWAYSLGLAVVGVSIAIGIEERERMLASIRLNRSRYESLFANMLDGLVHGRLVERDGKPVDCEVLTVNPEFERLCGLEQVAGRRFTQILPGFVADHSDVLAALAHVVQTGEARRWVQHLPQTDRWYSIGAYRPAAGEFIAVVENISQRIRAEQQLRKLSIAVEQCPVSIVITDRSGSIEYVNPAFTAASGYAPEEVLGRNPRVLQSGRTPRSTFESLWAALAAGKVWHGEFINQRKNGSHYFETATISALRRPDGSISHYVGVKEDTTELKRAVSELRATDDRLRLAKTAAGLGIFDFDVQVGALQWDERVRELWGAAAQAAVTLDEFLAALEPADQAPARRSLERALEPGGTGEWRAHFRVLDHIGGQVRQIAVIAQAFFEEGRCVRLVGTVQDVSEDVRLQREVQERRGEMELLVNQQVAAQTAAAIAHELNQPLVAISAYSEAAVHMLEAPTRNPEKLERALRGAMAQAQRAGSTLHELLDFLQQGESAREALDLNALVRDAVSIAEESGYGRFQAVLELQPDLPLVMANRLQIQKVLVNLLHNSIEATASVGVGAADVSIIVKTDESRNMAQVTVRDHGPGLSPELVDRVFKPFFTTKASGIGLGLAISRALVEAHGGQLWADVDAKPGASFHFVLPFA